MLSSRRPPGLRNSRPRWTRYTSSGSIETEEIRPRSEKLERGDLAHPLRDRALRGRRIGDPRWGGDPRWARGCRPKSRTGLRLGPRTGTHHTSPRPGRPRPFGPERRRRRWTRSHRGRSRGRRPFGWRTALLRTLAGTALARALRTDPPGNDRRGPNRPV